MLKRSIDIERDPSDPTIGENILRGAKRVCVVFAVGAVALSALDLMNIRSATNAAEFIHSNRQRVAEFPDLIRAEIQSAALASPFAVAMIPRGEIAMTPRLTRSAAADARVIGDASPVAELAAVHHMDAIEFAMEAPPSWRNAQAPLVAAPVPAPKPVILASADPASLPLAPITPTPVSLPMANAAPLDLAPVPQLALSALAEARDTDDAAPAAEPAATRDLDAAEAAKEPPPASAKPEPPIAAAPAPAPEPAPKPMILASADPAPLPESSVAPTPVSLPMSAAIPLDSVPLPRPAPGAAPPSPAERLHLEGKERAKAERCLSNAIYFEARDQPYQGQVAVAQVVINRVFSGVYPRDVCGVIYQNASRHLACQFTFACDGKSKAINEFGSWARARRIARETLDGQLYVPAVATSTHYHAAYVHPNWVREMHRYAREGIHLFYRPIAWGNGSDEPIWSREQLAASKNKKVAVNKKH